MATPAAKPSRACLHLRPLEEEENDPIFESAFNHLDTAVKKKLVPGSMQDELKNIHVHLSVAASHFPHVLSITERAAQVAFRPIPNGV